MMPDAFLFDMDGLILDSERVYGAVARDILVPHGFAAHAIDAHFLTLVGVSGDAARHRLALFLGPDFDLNGFNVAWHAEVSRRVAETVPLRPTVRDSLERLAGQGARMAVVTSTNGDTARKHLDKAGLLRHFEAVVGGNEVPARKPDPAPYLQAATALAVDPTRCAAFEDSDSGITAAVRAGCIAVQVPDLRPVDTPLPSLGQRVAPDLWAAIEEVGGFGIHL
ncbi:HAD family phosphatase [uncultured Tateyamaria sp.]|uniref:HAD family hydrolase n=1 Tax=uncultured Tateyamaria sp. TaxID=455651 RepID=UPI002605001D|nr:HAD family phosphatase [uncultured Tateyamaria sp.]